MKDYTIKESLSAYGFDDWQIKRLLETGKLSTSHGDYKWINETLFYMGVPVFGKSNNETF